MIQIKIQADVAEQIRHADGDVELVDDRGIRVGYLRRWPTPEEIQFAKSRLNSDGPKLTIDQLIQKVESL